MTERVVTGRGEPRRLRGAGQDRPDNALRAAGLAQRNL